MKQESSTSVYSLNGLKQILRRDIGAGLTAAYRHRYLIAVLLCVAKLTLQVFSITTIVTLACLAASLRGLALQQIDEILKRGLAYYLPMPLKNALLNRSLLDILCDMWFIPTMSVYIKTMMAPVLSNKRRGPEEAVKYLDPLEPKQREFFIRKGLAFLFPRKITKILLPRDYFQNPLIERALTKKESFHMENNDISEPDSVLWLPRRHPEQNKHLLNTKNVAPHQVPVVNNSRQLTLQNQTAGGDHSVIKVIDMANPAASSPTIKKSKVLLSSHMLRNLQNMPGRIDPTWDNIKEYERMKSSRPIARSHSNSKMNILHLVMGLKQFELMSKMSKGTAYKVTGVSTLAILAQLVFFKKTRKWTMNMLLLLSFTGGITLLLGSLAYLFFMKQFSSKSGNLSSTPSQLDLQLALKAREQEKECAEGYSEESSNI